VKNMDDEILALHWRVNVLGTWNCTKALLGHMIKRRYGRIVNMSSVTGPRVSDPGMMAYGMSKGAVLAFTKTTAVDVARYGITVNAILPGYILTPMVQRSAEESWPADPRNILESIARGVPLGRLGDPREVGYLAAFLSSDEASYITGAEMVIDGGSTLPETAAMGLKE
jgi:NAD(P)-dependent dehydrogenase (short-subunit alcohol dehydrogenase family)